MCQREKKAFWVIEWILVMVLWNPKGQSRRNLTLPSTFCGLGQVSPLVILSQKKKKLFLSKTSSFLFWVMHFRILVNSCCSWEREPQVCPPGTAVIICNASSSQGRYQPGVYNYCRAPSCCSRINSSPLSCIFIRSLHPPIQSLPKKTRGTVLAPVSCPK